MLSNRKATSRKGKAQLVDATTWCKPLRKNLGKKNCELGPNDIKRICDAFLQLKEDGTSKVFSNDTFGYWRITVERPLRLKTDLTAPALRRFRKACAKVGEDDLVRAAEAVAETRGPGPHMDFNVSPLMWKMLPTHLASA